MHPRPSLARRCLGAVTLCSLLLPASRARAWILPEHAQITAEATVELSAEERAALQSLWDLARRENAGLCAVLGRAPQSSGGAVDCLGFADLPSVAGDHSCTPEELFHELRDDTWLRDVVEVGNVTERRLRDARSDSARINAWSRSNLLLERADSEYALRATTNEGHFVPTAPPGQSLDEYLRQAIAADVPLNAAGLYVAFHLAALSFAAAHAGAPSTDERQRLAWLAVFSEAFALHFLEDSFSSGHTVGTWGGPALLKGTHDAYSVDGLPSQSWSGEAYSPYGDAHMTAADLRRARGAVATSLQELTEVLLDPGQRATVAQNLPLANLSHVSTLDTCRRETLGFRLPPDIALQLARPVWVQTVMPMPGKEHAHMPRFRAEIGPFFAFGAGTDASAIWGGYFSEHASSARANANVIVFAGIGIGLEGAIGLSSDGLIELAAGWTFASSQYEPGCSDCGADESGSLPSRVPTRSGLLLHYRAPYWLIPGDLFLAAPVLLAADFNTYKNMAIISANGGLLGLQQVILTPAGTFQFVLGRELNVTLFNGDDRVLSYDGGDPEAASSYTLFEVNSVKLDAPVLTYQPFRSFSNTLTSALGLQLGAALDIPSATDARTGAESSPGLAYSVYLRLALQSRWYLGTAAP